MAGIEGRIPSGVLLLLSSFGDFGGLDLIFEGVDGEMKMWVLLIRGI